MKKIMFGIVASVIVGNVAFGQGQVNFVNTSSTAQKIFLSGTVGGQTTTQVGAQLPGSATTSYTFALFVNTALNGTAGVPSTLTPSATPWTGAGGWNSANGGGEYALNTALTGRLLGVDNAAGTVTLTGYAVGANANFEVIGWNTAVGGSTVTSFVNAYNQDSGSLVWGYSGVANITLGDNGVTLANLGLFGAASGGGMSGFTLAPEAIVATPEPSSLALAGLGGFGMLMAFRRKKA